MKTRDHKSNLLAAREFVCPTFEYRCCTEIQDVSEVAQTFKFSACPLD